MKKYFLLAIIILMVPTMANAADVNITLDQVQELMYVLYGLAAVMAFMLGVVVAI